MTHEMTFKERMLDKYPGMDKPTNCSVCHTDLQYLFRIHRIAMKWYCHKCYIKYKEKKI
jgi:hypothetical protein